jgi:fibronectin-binding autotransporter adhesin
MSVLARIRLRFFAFRLMSPERRCTPPGSGPRRESRSGVLALSIAVIAMVGLCGGSQALGQAYTWNTIGGGSWNQSSNWTPSTSFPNGFNDTAAIRQDISGAKGIDLNTAIMLNRLTLGDLSGTSSYTIQPNGGSLTFRAAQSSQNTPSITSWNGANAITAPITSDNASVTVSNTGGGSLSLSSISSARGGGYHFRDSSTTVLAGMTSVNGIGNVFAIHGPSGSPQNWVTYDPVTGAVGQFTSYVGLVGATGTSNVTQLTNSTTSLTVSTTMNSFRWTTNSSGATLVLAANDMTILSGGFLRSASPNHNTTVASTGGKIKTPTGVPLTVWQNSSNNMTFNAALDVDGLNVFGRLTLGASGSASTFGTGDINVFGGGSALTFQYPAPSLSNNVNISNEDGSQFSFAPASAGTMTLSGTVMVNGILTGNANGSYAINTLTGYGSSRVTPITVTTTLAPGDGGTGTLDLNNNLTLAAASTYKVQLGGNTPGDGKGFYDQVNMTLSSGSITLNPGAGLNISLVNGFTPIHNDMFFILNRFDSAAWTTKFAGLDEGARVTFGSNHGYITYRANWTGSQAGSTATGGNDVAIVTVPEPGTISLLALGGLTLAGMHWRRRSRRSA